MYQKVINHFKNISTIPHCSFETSKLMEHIKAHAKKYNFEIHEDKAGNILCKKGTPTICLQSHYDMVCMGKAPLIESYEENGWLMAKNSSLGADNGMGVAISLALMEVHEDLECLFTNDEEVGLLGAENLKLPISSNNLLNLDSEEENEVIIGCAGGLNIFASIKSDYKTLHEQYNAYEISVLGLDGGHSGVDIAKNIKSAIKILALTLAKNKCKLFSINGGERNNSIAKEAKAIVFAKKKPISNNPHVKIKPIDIKEKKVLKYSKNIIHMLNAFSQGVRVYDEELKMPLLSINVSTIKEIDEKIVIEFFARSMDEEGLDEIKSEMKSLLKGFGFNIKVKDRNSPWKPEKNEFSKYIKSVSEKYIKNVTIKAVHAGLECGVIVKKQKHIKGVCSIGPTIQFPHSERERCSLASVENITNIVNEVIKNYKA